MGEGTSTSDEMKIATKQRQKQPNTEFSLDYRTDLNHERFGAFGISILPDGKKGEPNPTNSDGARKSVLTNHETGLKWNGESKLVGVS